MEVPAASDRPTRPKTRGNEQRRIVVSSFRAYILDVVMTFGYNTGRLATIRGKEAHSGRHNIIPLLFIEALQISPNFHALSVLLALGGR